MASLNQVQLIGYLGCEPELKKRDTYQFMNLPVATDESYADSSGNKIQKTEWHRISVRDKMAENCAKYLHKGSLVYVEGKIASRKYTDSEGYERLITEIRAYRIQFLDRKADKQVSEEPSPIRKRQSDAYGSNIDDVPF